MNNLLVFELPHYHFGAGGIAATIQLMEEMQRQGVKVHLRFQRQYPGIDYSKIGLSFPYSIGYPDKTFPECAVCITYSDTTHLAALAALPQVKRVAVNMLSYGMAPVREKFNATFPGVIVLSTTARTARMIEADGGGPVHVTHHGHDWENFYPEPGVYPGKARLGALLYHNEPDKRYDLGVKIMDRLCAEGFLDGVLTFGTHIGYLKHRHPKKHIRFYLNAVRAEVRELFSKASVFVMPSVTEGFNLTPIESTLCGCPAILCDGAIGDKFFHGENCFIAEKDNAEEMLEMARQLIRFPVTGENFRLKMAEIVKPYTWELCVNKILEALKWT
jgi:glycosyltransferase involved in cell wall biosynthesis